MNTQKETWKDIERFAGIYQVSDLGNVRSLDRYDSMGRFWSGKQLTPQFDGRKNYLHVNLCGTTYQIHTLVAKAFVKNPNMYKEVNHIDERKTNNKASNLEWCSRKYNNLYGSRGAHWKGENNPSAKLSNQEVVSILEQRKQGDKLKNIAARYGVSLNHICNICNGKRRGEGNYNN